jgi:hypothetical protein
VEVGVERRSLLIEKGFSLTLGFHEAQRTGDLKDYYCHTVSSLILYMIAKLWNQPRFPSTDEWMNKMCYVHKMEFYSAIKKN